MRDANWRSLPPLGLLLATVLAFSSCSNSSMLLTKPVILAEGTPLKVRLVSTLSTKNVAVGNTFEANLAAPLVVGGKTIAPEGAKVTGKVVEAKKSGRVKGLARLGIQLTNLETEDGGAVGIATNTITRRARSTKGKDAQKIGMGGAAGAAIGAIAGGGTGAAIGAAAGAGAGTGVVLATRGAPAVFPSESELTFMLKYPVMVS